MLLLKASDEFRLVNMLRAVRLEAIYFLRSDFCKFRTSVKDGCT